MKISEWRKHINAELDRIEKEHGDLPVTCWVRGDYISEYPPTLPLEVVNGPYTSTSGKTRDDQDGMTVLIGY